jgi:transcriptional regulator with XRE-family HTH domain
MPIGERLRAERERLNMSQPVFAALAQTTKQTLFSWESGKTAPDGFQLAALAAAGVDASYVLTGQRSQSVAPTAALPPRVKALVDNYQAADDAGKRVIEGTANLAAQSAGGSRRAAG